MFHIINIAHAAGIIEDALTFQEIAMKVLNFLLLIFGVLAIIALVLSGILYFFSAGDKRKIEIAKKFAMYSTLGIVLTFGSMVLIRLIGSFFN